MEKRKNAFESMTLSPEILKERAREYAREEESIDIQGDLKEFLSFRLGEAWCLIEMCFVHEVVRPANISRLPRHAEFFRGMMNVRGAMIPVIDLEKLLKRSEVKIQKSSRIILIELHHEMTGVIVDEVDKTLSLDTAACQSLTSTFQEIETQFIRGLFMHDEKHSVWFDVESILREVRTRLTT